MGRVGLLSPTLFAFASLGKHPSPTQLGFIRVVVQIAEVGWIRLRWGGKRNSCGLDSHAFSFPRSGFSPDDEMKGDGAPGRREHRPYVASPCEETPRLTALRRGVCPASGRAFRETLPKETLLRQPCSRQASLVSPGGAPMPLLSLRCERMRRSAASRSAHATPREAPLR